uniref:Uncharacterized protein n=1 Tax=Lepeophtheirus salmonis TaxID=72036 RepID=A0A0K2T739_LEPSM
MNCGLCRFPKYQGG